MSPEVEGEQLKLQGSRQPEINARESARRAVRLKLDMLKPGTQGRMGWRVCRVPCRIQRSLAGHTPECELHPEGI